MTDRTPPMPLFAGIHTIWCYVSDMPKAVAFYRDVLGLQTVYESENWTSFAVGPSGRLGLHWGLPEPPTAANWILGFVTPDLRLLRRRLEESGHRTGHLHEIPDGVVLEVRDPDGNLLQATQLGTRLADLEDGA
jgi:catechol 2,3-dioxygenase-like lactoylglutathione lyase family enzyme